MLSVPARVSPRGHARAGNRCNRWTDRWGARPHPTSIGTDPEGICPRTRCPSTRPRAAGPLPGQTPGEAQPSLTMSQGAPHDRLLEEARERFDEAEDFTVSVEEEFALLDPETLELVNRFEECPGGGEGTTLESRTRGRADRLRGRGQDGKQASFADVPSALAERRAELAALVDPLGLMLGATGTHPWSSWRDQRIIDTPHYRRNNQLLPSSGATPSACTPTPSEAPTGPSRSSTHSGTGCPRCSPCRRAPPSTKASYLSLATQVFTRFFPRCGVPDAFGSWDAHAEYVRFLYDGVGRRADTALVECPSTLAFPPSRSICDAQPDLAEAESSSRSWSRSRPVAPAHSTRASRCRPTHRLIEENMWRAIRHGCPASSSTWSAGTSFRRGRESSA